MYVWSKIGILNLSFGSRIVEWECVQCVQYGNGFYLVKWISIKISHYAVVNCFPLANESPETGFVAIENIRISLMFFLQRILISVVGVCRVQFIKQKIVQVWWSVFTHNNGTMMMLTSATGRCSNAEIYDTKNPQVHVCNLTKFHPIRMNLNLNVHLLFCFFFFIHRGIWLAIAFTHSIRT